MEGVSNRPSRNCFCCRTSPSKINATECNQMPCRCVTELSSSSLLEPKGDFSFHSHKPWTMLEMSVHALCPAAAQGSHGRRWSHGQRWGSCPYTVQKEKHPREKALLYGHIVCSRTFGLATCHLKYTFFFAKGDEKSCLEKQSPICLNRKWSCYKMNPCLSLVHQPMHINSSNQ